VNATVVASRRLREALEGMGLRRLVTIPLGTDTELFQPADGREAVRAELGVPKEAMLLLYVGRLGNEKNLPALLQMVDRLLRAGSSVHLAVAGDGERRDRVRRRARSGRGVSWLGYCTSTTRLAELYSAADLVVHAGTAETFGLSALEAQACGTRVLAVRGGGVDEAVEGENPTVLARSAAPDDLADGVRRVQSLGEGPEARIRRRERIVARFPVRRTFEALMRLYEHLSRGEPAETWPG
jgi:alpha-1,6-mannosyltransferase